MILRPVRKERALKSQIKYMWGVIANNRVRWKRKGEVGSQRKRVGSNRKGGVKSQRPPPKRKGAVKTQRTLWRNRLYGKDNKKDPFYRVLRVLCKLFILFRRYIWSNEML